MPKNTEETNNFAYRCPACGDVNHIDISMSVWGRLIQQDDGDFQTDTDEAESGDHEWDDDSAAICRECGFRATAVEFDTENQCRECGDFYPQGGDGYDGMCPSCADQAEARR